MQTINRFFGINPNSPATVSGTAGSYIFAAPLGAGMGTPTPAGRMLSDVAMPFQILTAPGGGRLNGQTFTINAAGDITIPASASSATANLVLAHNTFISTFVADPRGNRYPYWSDLGGTTSIETTSTTLASLPSAQSLTSGSYSWSLTATLSGDGNSQLVGVNQYWSGNPNNPPVPAVTVQSGSGILSGLFEISLGGISSRILPLTNKMSSWTAFAEPCLQLSMAVTFTGTLSGTALFSATLSQFQIQA